MLSRGRGGIEQAFLNMACLIHTDTDYEQLAVLDTKSPLSLPNTIPQERLSQFADWDPIGLYRLKNIVTTYKPDLILCHGNRPLKMTLLLRQLGQISGQIVGFCHNYRVRHLLKADAVIAVSQHMIDDHLIPAGYAPDKAFHLPNMIDLSGIEPITIKPMTNPVVIGTMGRFVEKKGVEDFIKAVSILHNQNVPLKAIIGGTGPEESALKELTHKQGLNDIINFVGWIHDKRAFYDQLNVFCIPSHEEPFGIIALDTLAYGCPLISTTAKGLAEILNGQDVAVLCETHSPEKLAQAIKQATQLSTDQVQQKQEKGLQLVKRYDVQVTAQHFKNVVKEITVRLKSLSQ